MSVREKLEAAIERAIAILDAFDSDPDFEDGGDLESPEDDLEPSLGSIGAGDERQSQASWWCGRNDEREDEHDGAEPNVDDELSGDEHEPSIGAPNCNGPCYSQERWGERSPLDTFAADLEEDAGSMPERVDYHEPPRAA